MSTGRLKVCGQHSAGSLYSVASRLNRILDSGLIQDPEHENRLAGIALLISGFEDVRLSADDAFLLAAYGCLE